MEIEIASYALLTYTLKRNKVNGMMILDWLVKQRNSYGGFASTQVKIQKLYERAEDQGHWYSGVTMQNIINVQNPDASSKHNYSIMIIRTLCQKQEGKCFGMCGGTFKHNKTLTDFQLPFLFRTTNPHFIQSVKYQGEYSLHREGLGFHLGLRLTIEEM